VGHIVLTKIAHLPPIKPACFADTAQPLGAGRSLCAGDRRRRSFPLRHRHPALNRSKKVDVEDDPLTQGRVKARRFAYNAQVVEDLVLVDA
jgi:hypothetical protein